MGVVQDSDAAASRVANPLSFEEFFAAESEALYRRRRLVTRDHHEAEEVVQDAFLSLYERWDRIAGIPIRSDTSYRTAFNAWKKRSRRAAQAIRKGSRRAGLEQWVVEFVAGNGFVTARQSPSGLGPRLRVDAPIALGGSPAETHLVTPRRPVGTRGPGGRPSTRTR